MDINDLEKLYKDKLQDLEINPNAAVWDKIESSLNSEKKVKKRVLFWFISVGSIAALFLIGFFVFNSDIKLLSKNKMLVQTDVEKENFKKVKIKKNNVKQTTLTAELVASEKITESAELERLERNKERFVKNRKVLKKDFTALTPVKTKAILSKLKNNFLPKKVIQEKFEKEIAQIKSVKKPAIKNQTILPKKSLEKELMAEVLVDEEKKFINLDSQKKWSIAPVVSQYITSYSSNNSPLDSRLNTSKKSNSNSVSYGMNLAYKVSDKLKIKGGIHKISFTQTTIDSRIRTSSNTVFFTEAARASSVVIKTSTLSLDQSLSLLSNPKKLMTNNNTKSFSSKEEESAQLQQQFGYVEIPLELSYKLWHTHKIAFNVSGGLSTLVLTDNNLETIGTTFSFSNGEASNLNKVNFSFNIGTDVEYHFSDQWFLNLNPSLKIQTRTFNQSNNHPYLLGITTGVNYKF